MHVKNGVGRTDTVLRTLGFQDLLTQLLPKLLVLFAARWCAFRQQPPSPEAMGSIPIKWCH
jgi:hypothetical protein